MVPPLNEILGFLTSQARDIGERILLQRQASTKLVLDDSKPMPVGGIPAIVKAHTSVDDDAQEAFLKSLLKFHPGSAIICEEQTESCHKFASVSDHIYYGDLLDGSYNYCRQSPNFGLSVGYAYKGKIMAGVLYLPSHNTLIAAMKGKGTQIGNKTVSLKPASPSVRSGDKIAFNSIITPDCNALSRKSVCNLKPLSTVYSLYMLLSSSVKAYIGINMQVYDVAVGSMMIEEAGGFVGDHTLNKIDFSRPGILPNYAAAVNSEYARNALMLFCR